MIKEVNLKDKQQFNKLAVHPLQSWEWGDFRIKTGIEVIRLGNFADGILTETAQITIHQIPFTSMTIGYFPKGNLSSDVLLKELAKYGKKNKCIFIKFEPNVKDTEYRFKNSELNIKLSPHPLFTKYSFQLDLTKNEDDLLINMHPKTRYNIKVAQKHGVIVKEDNSDKAFEKYWQLTEETTKRQKFFAHDKKYHQLMWETLKPAGIAHLLTAYYKGETLVSWIVFLFNNVLYYPYGASSDKFRNVMASNIMMWEVIRWGKKNGAKLFDMWGALGPSPDPNNPWYGFHRFKEGYGPKLVEFVGSYDLVINPFAYNLYNLIDNLREVFLKLKK